MAKKKKEPRLEAWCWYCDRDFEDDKVLLNHQKAKHYRCPYCPRRLNTAGGLTVHLHQVHKAEPTKIENALPGRETFDIEIYGMVGIPEADLAEWKARRGNTQGQGSGGPSLKRQKVENVALTPEQLKAQLEAHKALMSGKAPPPGAVAGQFHSFTPGVPPPMYGYPPTGPPPGGFGGPPPPFYNRPPPPMFHRPPPGMAPPSAGPYSGPPPALYSSGPPPALYSSGPPPPLIGMPPPSSSSMNIPHITLPSTNPHQEAVKAGAKSRMVYSDLLMSPEEKLASTSKYLFIDPEEAKQNYTSTAQFAPPPTSSMNPGLAQQQQYNGPPPGFGVAPSPGPMSSPYAASPHSPYIAQQQYQQYQPQQSQQPLQQQYAHGGSGSPLLQGPPPAVNFSATPAHSHAQSYPSISNGGKGGIEPASLNPEENTAEALAKANVSIGSGVEREADMAGMQERANDERDQGANQIPDPVGITEVTSSHDLHSTQGQGKPGRAKASDLF
ncbi:hypothetical protein CBS101457_001925 [Exobasidium rhododendri]|nr:hypothetical protein CBS101457_001925 [Exobasidium rhododendri]